MDEGLIHQLMSTGIDDTMIHGWGDRIPKLFRQWSSFCDNPLDLMMLSNSIFQVEFRFLTCQNLTYDFFSRRPSLNHVRPGRLMHDLPSFNLTCDLLRESHARLKAAQSCGCLMKLKIIIHFQNMANPRSSVHYVATTPRLRPPDHSSVFLEMSTWNDRLWTNKRRRHGVTKSSMIMCTRMHLIT